MVYDNASNVYAGMGQDLAAGNSTDIFAHGAGGGFITFGNLGTNKTTYTEWVRISTTGNLLIGTTTDFSFLGTTSLNVEKNLNSGHNIRISNQANNSSASANLIFGAFGNSWINGIGSNSSTLANNLYWAVDASTSPLQYKMVLTTGGNLLVGTTTDAGFKLDVNGTGRFSNQITGPSSAVTEGKFNFIGYNNAYGGITANTGFNTNYNAVSIYSNFNSTRNGQGNTSNPSWILDLGGSIPDPDSFGIFRSPAGSFTFTNLFKITSGGNVGIGTSSPSEVLTIASGGKIATFRSGNDRRGVFYTDNSATWLESDTAGNDPLALKAPGSSANILFYTSTTEKMRITSSGTLLVGGTSDIAGGIIQALGSSGTIITTRSTSSGGNQPGIRFYHDGNDEFLITGGASLRFLSSGVNERMRLTSGGNLLIATTTDAGYTLNVAGNAQIIKSSTSTALVTGLSGVTGSIIRFSYNGSFVGSISTDGSNTAYNTSSDYRLKDEIRIIDNPLEKVMKLNPVSFRYKNSKTRQDGFIAHEIQEILPYLVTGEKDGIDMQEVDYSKLTPILIAAIKELKKEIDTLKN
jgi:hypothetical protein